MTQIQDIMTHRVSRIHARVGHAGVGWVMQGWYESCRGKWVM